MADEEVSEVEDIEACEKAGMVPYMCRGHSVVPQSRRACSARTSFNTTTPPTFMFTRRVSVFILIHRPCCAI